MKVMSQFLLVLALVIAVSSLAATFVHGSSNDNERKAYIVYMGEAEAEAEISSIVNDHHNLLLAAVGDESMARQSKIYSYGRSFNGFAARLLPHEVQRLKDHKRVASVFENKKKKLHTTRSWDFIGMSQLLERRPNVENDIIVALLDTGIDMSAPSFNDSGYGPAPTKWKGKCDRGPGPHFTGCNNKVIGAKYYKHGYALDDDDEDDPPSPADDDGHGTHTSSTAAGIAVSSASLYGIAKGTARGGVPLARIAMYKVCWRNEDCSDVDILAAFDDAVADGVDVISVSVGGYSSSFLEDSIAIGSFHAMKKGILTSCSGGNDGPTGYTVGNVAPWILTVAASSIDRQFVTPVKFGNGALAVGITLNTFTPNKTTYPLTNGALASNNPGQSDDYLDRACADGSLSKEKVEGKIVYCLDGYARDSTIRELQGAGIIWSLYSPTDIAYSYSIPASSVSSSAGSRIDHYINSTKNPRAVIYKTRTRSMDAPFVASFSSRGPQTINLNILKPDISAPGLNILAAYPKLFSVTGDPVDNRFASFHIMSGTSMACPHVAAAAAYVKTFHPDWSPSAIKSALMTTAKPMKIKLTEAELGSGSGQIDARRAVHPGLVYDMTMTSYISFLCKEGYNSTTISLLVGGTQNYNCSDYPTALGTDGLNYPTMHTQILSPDSQISAVFYRTVTNVGYNYSVYKATVRAPQGLFVTVVPDTLKFDKFNEKREFKVVVEGDASMQNGTQVLSALLQWSDSSHTVSSPIVICGALNY